MAAMPSTRFRRVSVEQLARQPEEAILDYAARAKQAGHREEALTAVHLMLFLHRERMEDRIALRLPRHLAHHRATVAAWVLERVMISALKLQLRGTSVGEWVVWWQPAIDRQVVSFWRSAQGQALQAEAPLPSEREADEDAPRDALGVPFDEDAVLSGAECGDIVRTVLDGLDNRMHASVVQRAIFDDLPSAEVAEEHDTTANNVDAIKKRFREAVRREYLARGVEA
jgi:DNA-directed RNA polymerase specialized sigma24 family protein